MNIENLEISNFKSIKDLNLEGLKPITGIWGKNGTGKSSILQALVVIRNALAREAIPLPHILNEYSLLLGNLEDVAFMRDYSNNPIVIKIQLDNGHKSYLEMGDQVIPDFDTFDFPEKVRYFPPWRRISNKVSNPSTSLKRDFVQNIGNIHSYIHWFVHQKMYEKSESGERNEWDKINDWSRKLGYGDILDELIRTNEVMGTYKDPELNIFVPLISGGYGGSTFLPILLESYSFEDGILLIEEPEISLHPGAQSDILDFIIEMATERNHQIIFTSHSEYLLRKIARYFSKDRLDDETLEVLCASKSNEGTQISRIDSDELSKKLERGPDILPELTERVS